MPSVKIRDLLHHFSKHMKLVKAGKTIVILERNIPIADIVPHNENIARPGWKRKIKKIESRGEPFSDTVVRMRREEDR